MITETVVEGMPSYHLPTFTLKHCKLLTTVTVAAVVDLALYSGGSYRYRII